MEYIYSCIILFHIIIEYILSLHYSFLHYTYIPISFQSFLDYNFQLFQPFFSHAES